VTIVGGLGKAGHAPSLSHPPEVVLFSAFLLNIRGLGDVGGEK